MENLQVGKGGLPPLVGKAQHRIAPLIPSNIEPCEPAGASHPSQPVNLLLLSWSIVHRCSLASSWAKPLTPKPAAAVAKT
jgi:hypothetical protein